MGVYPKKTHPRPFQVKKRHHKQTRPSYYKDPISKSTLPPHLAKMAQKGFDSHQRQNRAWLHNQMDMPGNNGISKYQHAELKKWFSFRTIREQIRPPLAKEGVRLSQASKAHIARLERERNAEREKQGVPWDWAPVDNWWHEASGKGQHFGKKKGKGKSEKKSKENGLEENSRARRNRAFMERKDKEREEREAAARLAETRKGIGKMRIQDQDKEDMVSEEGEEESCGGEMAIKSLNEGEEQKTEPHRWVDELPIREVRR